MIYIKSTQTKTFISKIILTINVTIYKYKTVTSTEMASGEISHKVYLVFVLGRHEYLCECSTAIDHSTAHHT